MAVEIGGSITGDFYNAPDSLKYSEQAFTNEGVIVGRYIGGVFTTATPSLISPHNTTSNYYIRLTGLSALSNTDFMQAGTNPYIQVKRQGVYKFVAQIPVTELDAGAIVQLGIRINNTDYLIGRSETSVAVTDAGNTYCMVHGQRIADLAPDSNIAFFIVTTDASIISTNIPVHVEVMHMGWMSGGSSGGGGGGGGGGLSTSALFYYTVQLEQSHIDNKYISLPYSVTSDQDDNVQVRVRGMAEQLPTYDYEVDASFRDRITWDGLGLEEILWVGDIMHVIYM